MKNDWIEISAKTVDEAITEGLIKLQTKMDKMEYEVLEKESSGFFGLFGKHEAKIRVRIKEEKPEAKPVPSVENKISHKEGKQKEKSVSDSSLPVQKVVKTKSETKVVKENFNKAEEKRQEEVKREPASEATVEKAKAVATAFLKEVFRAMKLETEINFSFDKEENELLIDVKSDDMGILIGKRGQTLDSLQYIVSLVVNKESEEYVKIKLDSENYRVRRKETLENLAKNIASKVKRTGRQVSLEPMNSFERRIIHSALQGDEEIETYSEGNDPYRKVVVKLKGERRNYGRYNKGGYGNKKPYYKKPYAKNGGYRGYNKYKKYDENESSETSEIQTEE